MSRLTGHNVRLPLEKNKGANDIAYSVRFNQAFNAFQDRAKRGEGAVLQRTGSAPRAFLRDAARGDGVASQGDGFAPAASRALDVKRLRSDGHDFSPGGWGAQGPTGVRWRCLFNLSLTLVARIAKGNTSELPKPDSVDASL